MLPWIQIDLLEPVSHFLDAARINLAPENLMVIEEHKAVNFYCVSLQVTCVDMNCFEKLVVFFTF